MKDRNEPLELKIYRCLTTRMDLDPSDKKQFENLEKGYKGEKRFDDWLKESTCEGIILNDLLFETNHTFYQIDSLYIDSNTITLFEVKNYEGDFFIEGDKWYSTSKLEIKNPLLQLKRNESLFRRLLQEHNFSFSVEAYVVFVNPAFHLYHASPNHPIVFPTQLSRFTEKLNKKTAALRGVHSKLAEKLLSLHVAESPYSRLPKYTYDELRKGINCRGCGRFYDTFLKTTVICSHCNQKEGHHMAVLRGAKEFQLLFPDQKITTDHIYHWCGKIIPKRTIWKILASNFKLRGHAKSSFYT